MSPSPLKKERETLEDAASRLVEQARAAGAAKAEVCGVYHHRTKIALEKQDFHMASADDGYQLGLRVLRGARQGFASGNTTDPAELKEIATRAVEIAGFAPENPYHTIAASPNLAKGAPAEALWDEALHQLSIQTQKDWTKLMADEALRDPRFRLNEGAVTISTGLFVVMNSEGTLKLERETRVDWTLMGMAVDGDNITSFDYFSQLSRAAARTPERIQQTTREFRERVIGDLKHGPAKSYRGPVVFSPRAVIEILLPPLAYQANGRTVAEKAGRWSLESLGKPLFDTRLTVRDLPWLVDRFSCSTFDREGTPTQPMAVVENGVLRNFFLDGYAGRALNRATTGHAVGGPGGPPSVSSHCLCVEGGDESQPALLARIGADTPELLVLNRYSGQVDPVTGDFSGVAKGGEWWRGGERAYVVKETLVSGNVFEALAGSVLGLSRETRVVDAGDEAPAVALGNVSVTAG